MRRASIAFLGILALGMALAVGLASVLAPSCGQSDRGVGRITGPRHSAAHEVERVRVQAAARSALAASSEVAAKAGGQPARQILFGDLHVHTTFSIDAFLQALPLFGGEGAHPPADACDYARYCADLDFFSLNDHAESLVPARWRETKESVRECSARAGEGGDPDLVAFVGYEWTQAGPTPATHFGHKNVVFRGLDDSEIAPRPIDSLPADVADRARGIGLVSVLAEFDALGLYADLLWLVAGLATLEPCPTGVDTRDLPLDCRESAEAPGALFEKLAQAGHESLVIPHGLAWGLHAPPGARLDGQLAPGAHDPARERLVEIHSGHGNGEEMRTAHSLGRDGRGELVCPAPTADFLPCCWRAGEIMRERCGDLPSDECEARVEEAKRLALEAKTAPNLVFPETDADEWLDCDQCRDCFKPVFNPRPGMTAQYAAALSAAPRASGDEPRRFRWGFIASSDNHAGRPGTGYKQFARHGTTDVRGIPDRRLDAFVRPLAFGSSDDPRRPQAVAWEERSFRGLFNKERVASFLYPGGLVAAHSIGRDRDAIWGALARKEVYGTSGPRILLWFDLVDGDGAAPAVLPLPMGSEVELEAHPRFEVRAIGSRVQQPGCPPEAHAALSPERLERLCLEECHNPGDERIIIETIEVVRIRPQRRADEPIESLVEDPWLSLPCDGDPAGCTVRFDDPDFERDTVYYVRALQAPTEAINGANFRTRFDASGRAAAVEPCHAGWRTEWDDDCLAPVRERAWSSPIYVDRVPRQAGVRRPSPDDAEPDDAEGPRRLHAAARDGRSRRGAREARRADSPFPDPDRSQIGRLSWVVPQSMQPD